MEICKKINPLQLVKAKHVLGQLLAVRGLDVTVSSCASGFQLRSSSTWRARLTGVRVRVDYVLSWKAGFTLLEVM